MVLVNHLTPAQYYYTDTSYGNLKDIKRYLYIVIFC